MEMTGDVARTIVAVAKKIESLAGLIADGMEIVLSQAPTVTEDMEIIVQDASTYTLLPSRLSTLHCRRRSI
jgi:hypothetical protein